MNKLWCVHVLGPDYVYAMPNYRSAVVEAHKQQLALSEHVDFDNPDQVLISPRVMEWQGTAEGLSLIHI